MKFTLECNLMVALILLSATKTLQLQVKLKVSSQVRFTIGHFTIPIVKRSFLKRIFLNKNKVHFTIGIVKNLQ